ncbi:MAG: hypothetical protein ACEPOZ_06230 [Marinifilaceae bacterium]
MKKRQFYALLVLIVLFTFASCNFRNGHNNNGLADTLLTKTIFFPEKLLELDGVQFQGVDSFVSESTGKAKIISIIDGTCMKCIIHQLNRMDSIFNRIKGNDVALVFVLNVNKADSSYFMRNLQPAINATGILLWDNAYNFELRNKLLTSDAYLRTFLVNEKNRIIQYGNPIMNPVILTEYEEKMKRLGVK